MLDVLRSHFLFRDWSVSALEQLAEISSFQAHRKGKLLFLEEDRCDHLYALIDGRIQLFRSLADGRETTLNVVSGGGLVGCAALFLEHCFPASARVISPQARLIVVDGEPFLKMMDEDRVIARSIIAALARRPTVVAGRVESLMGETSMARVVNWLLDQPSHEGAGPGRCIQIENTKKALARSLGMTPETLSRHLAGLREQGIIAVKNREITILDPSELTRLAIEMSEN